MAQYEVQVQNHDTKKWEVLESDDSASRRKFLKGFDRNKVAKRQWQCVKK